MLRRYKSTIVHSTMCCGYGWGDPSVITCVVLEHGCKRNLGVSPSVVCVYVLLDSVDWCCVLSKAFSDQSYVLHRQYCCTHVCRHRVGEVSCRVSDVSICIPVYCFENVASPNTCFRTDVCAIIRTIECVLWLWSVLVHSVGMSCLLIS